MRRAFHTREIPDGCTGPPSTGDSEEGGDCHRPTPPTALHRLAADEEQSAGVEGHVQLGQIRVVVVLERAQLHLFVTRLERQDHAQQVAERRYWTKSGDRGNLPLDLKTLKAL